MHKRPYMYSKFIFKCSCTAILKMYICPSIVYILYSKHVMPNVKAHSTSSNIKEDLNLIGNTVFVVLGIICNSLTKYILKKSISRILQEI